jgi:hypothetical protein
MKNDKVPLHMVLTIVWQGDIYIFGLKKSAEERYEKVTEI